MRVYPETDWLVPGQDIADSRETRQDRGGTGRGGSGRDDDGRGGGDGPRGHGRRTLALVAVGLLLVAGAGAAGYKLLHKNRTNPITSGAFRLPSSNPTAQSSFYSAKLGKWQHIASRKEDPAALTVGELYPPVFMLNGKQYQRTAASLDATCGLAVFGDLLQAAFQSGTCTQVVRATYLSGDQKVMGTIGVANLSSVYWSTQAAKATTSTNELIAPLSASKGVTKNILNGTGLTFTVIKGHYLILMYVEFTSLKAPSGTAQTQQLVDFSQEMLNGSANIALSTRLYTGKP
jgi:hypothetical protein